MREPLKAFKITDNVYWVGAIDWGLRNFHGYETSRGTTYNAYLVLAEKIALIDTVKEPFKNELMSRISSIVNPKEIKYIISNHSELDHSGSLPAVIKEIEPEKVFASQMGVKNLAGHFREGINIEAVKDGERLNLGGKTLSFFETRMLHWPDSMFTYLEEEKVLFSQDAFGMHLASSERFDDEIEEQILQYEAAKYYANILMLYSPQVLKLLEKIPALGLKFNLIAPDHGPIWRSKPYKILALYKEWAERRTKQKAVIVYDTMWKSTEKMAKAIAEGLVGGGATVKVMPLEVSHRSEIAAELIDARAFIVGSPTLNNGMMPAIADIMTYIKGLRFNNLVGFAFGSYGWSGEGVKQINDMLSQMNVKLVNDGIKANYIPNEELLTVCYEGGGRVAEMIEDTNF